MWSANYGPTTVHVAAPGAYVWSSLPGGSYGGRSGSSVAAAVASGVAALVKARFSHLSSSALRARLLETADPLPPQARPLIASGGRLNALRAVQEDPPISKP